ncbi:MAG: N-acetylmuramic acid 6-phosphate etherase, partial [Hyphomonadaceae bacterium]
QIFVAENGAKGRGKAMQLGHLTL